MIDWKTQKENLTKIVAESFSWAEVCRKLNLSAAGGSFFPAIISPNFLPQTIDNNFFSRQSAILPQPHRNLFRFLLSTTSPLETRIPSAHYLTNTRPAIIPFLLGQALRIDSPNTKLKNQRANILGHVFRGKNFANTDPGNLFHRDAVSSCPLNVGLGRAVVKGAIVRGKEGGVFQEIFFAKMERKTFPATGKVLGESFPSAASAHNQTRGIFLGLCISRIWNP